MTNERQIVELLSEVGLRVVAEAIEIKKLENGHLFAAVNLDSAENRQAAKYLQRPRGISCYGIGENGWILYLVA